MLGEYNEGLFGIYQIHEEVIFVIESFTNPVSVTQKYITVSIDLTKSQQLKRVKI
jgi:hypothetical protein